MENNQQGQYYYPSAPLPNQYNIPICNPATVNNSRDIFINGNKITLPNDNSNTPINLNINVGKKTKKKEKLNRINTVKNTQKIQVIPNSRNKLSDFLPNEQEELYDYGIYLDIDILKYPFCLKYVIEAINCPLPEHWSENNDSKGNIFFYNKKLNESSWEHPMDFYYRNLIKEKKEEYKRNKKKCTIM